MLRLSSVQAIQQAYKKESYAQCLMQQLTANRQILNEVLMLNSDLQEQMKKPSVCELLAYKDKLHISGKSKIQDKGDSFT